MQQTAAPAPSYTPQQLAIYQAFNSDIYIRDQMDVQPTPLYDTVTVAAGSTYGPNNNWFVNVGAQSGKTNAQTNLVTSTQLASPEAFSIFQFRIYWSPNISTADLITVTNGFVMDFYIGKKIYQQGPYWFYPAGGGIFASTVQNNAQFLNNGLPDCRAARLLPTQLVIGAKATFYANPDGNPITLSGGGNGLNIMLLLEGFYARGVA